MRILINATDPASRLVVFGMTLLERQLYAILSAGLTPTEIYIALDPGAPEPPPLKERVKKQCSLQWVREPGSLYQHMLRIMHEGGEEPLLVLEADCVIDPRLLQFLATQSGILAACDGEGRDRAAVLRIDGPLSLESNVEGKLPRLVDFGVAHGAIQALPLTSIPGYIKKLRRELPIYLFRVTDVASRDKTERFLFWSNYKGSTDFFTKYVYPPLVWRIVRPLSRWRVHPNVVSLFNVGITFLAIPLFAWQWWWLGFLCAYTMSVLDSVDGKLARLTFTSSWFGNILDHGLDIVHPPLWYFGWAWGLSGGDTSSLVFRAAIWMAVIYALDRIVAGVFNRRLGRSIHGYTPLDERMRTFISRRNINLPLFLIGWLLDVPVPTFLVIVLWQIFCFVFHVERLVQFWNYPKAAVTG